MKNFKFLKEIINLSTPLLYADIKKGMKVVDNSGDIGIVTENENGNFAKPKLAAAYSFRHLEWDYYTPPKISNSFRKIVAQHKFELPEFMDEKRECTIDICELDYSWTGLVYVATIWWFDRGINIVCLSEGIKSMGECQKLVDERMFEFSTVFLGRS